MIFVRIFRLGLGGMGAVEVRLLATAAGDGSRLLLLLLLLLEGAHEKCRGTIAGPGLARESCQTKEHCWLLSRSTMKIVCSNDQADARMSRV